MKRQMWYCVVTLAFIQHFLQGATEQQAKFLCIAHRGAPLLSANENTLHAFKRAIRRDVLAIEFDVHRCASGEPVVIHDSFLYRTTREIGWIGDYTLAQIQRLKTIDGERIPSLAEVLGTIAAEESARGGLSVLINVELKGKGSAIPTARVIAKYIKEHKWSPTKFLVSSFLREELETFKKESPEIPLGLLIDWHPSQYVRCCALRAIPWDLCKKLDIQAIGIPYSLASKSIVDHVRSRSELINLFVYTVNCPRKIQWLKEIGVDGVFTDSLEFCRYRRA